MKKFCCIIMAALLSACALTPKTPYRTVPWQTREAMQSDIRAWTLRGKVNVRDTEQSETASLRWQQQGQTYTLNLLGPLGLGSIRISGNNKQVTYTSNKGTVTRNTSPEALMQGELGWHLPISDLYYWVRGLPVPKRKATKTLDTFGHLITLNQGGWDIVFADYKTVSDVDLPGQIILTRSPMRITLIIYRWEL